MFEQRIAGLTCPLPDSSPALIKLGHGSGGRMTADLIENVFLPALGNPILSSLDDAAAVCLGKHRIAVTTDSYVVNPIFFPGGDIGSLAVHGTVNDLAMRAARPLYLTASFILEEGLAIDDLRKITASMRQACDQAGIQLIAGDTKVVNRGAADRIFITTCGIGAIEYVSPPDARSARPGDLLLVSGQLGQHGMAIMCAREGLNLDVTLESDSAPLWPLVKDMLAASSSIHCLRDLTRGGLASATAELAVSSAVGIELDETAIPVHGQVLAACEILGLDPLYVACEGRLAAILPEDDAGQVLEAMKNNVLGTKACAIGRVVDNHAGQVILKTKVGGRRIVDKLSGEQLPRIC